MLYEPVVFTNKPGFMDEVDEQLMSEISPNLPASRRFIALLMDEMKVKYITNALVK